MTNKPDGKRWGWGNPVWIFVVVLIYVLSIGPACRLCFDHHYSTRALPYVYWPIWKISKFSVPGRATAFYLNLWGSSWRADYWDHDHGVFIGGP